ncbi:hypothetical protein V1477_015681 [Vespula maculifrons]|uniref:Uncharacterized protein n=1 Tax=Vespula maculifrons TaxID=7453 RepID=A0ABD2BB28_VESMC
MRARENDKTRKNRQKAYPEVITNTCTYGHRKEKKRKEKMNSTEIREYGNRAEFFGTERRRPAQKPTPKGPSQGTHPRKTMIINLE